MLALGAALVGGPGVAPAPGATRATSAADLRRRGAVRRAKNALTAITHGEPAESACVPRQDTGTATQAGQLHLRSPCGRARHRSAPRRAPKISIAQAVATIPSNASSSKTPPKPEAWLPRGNVLRPGDLRLVDLTVPRRALPTPPLSPRRRTEECARRERAHDQRADAPTLDGSALVKRVGRRVSRRRLLGRLPVSGRRPGLQEDARPGRPRSSPAAFHRSRGRQDPVGVLESTCCLRPSEEPRGTRRDVDRNRCGSGIEVPRAVTLLRILVSPQDRVPPLLQGLAQSQSRRKRRAHLVSTSNLGRADRRRAQGRGRRRRHAQ